MLTVGVIIPFYQTAQGVLRRTVESVLVQHVPPETRLELIIIDDGAPIRASGEVDGLHVPSWISVRVERQANGGCAAAREAGLRMLGDTAELVAFLDSDDSWVPDHLLRAVQALQAGADVYFSDHARVGHHASHFAAIGFIAEDLPSAAATNGVAACTTLDATESFAQCLTTFTAQISTLVYRRSIKPDAAFAVDLRLAGEDTLFILQLLAAARTVCVSREIEVVCGAGVNVYYGTFDWSDEGHIRRRLSDIIACRQQLATLRLRRADARLIRARIRESRRAFVFFSVRWAFKGHRRWSGQLRQLARKEGRIWRWFLPYLIDVAVRVAITGYRPAN